jgi:hypothetical protein
MRGVAGRPGWFWLFLLEGLLTIVLGTISFFWLPTSPTRTKSLIWRKAWYTEREETIMINRILRDDPAKGLTNINEPATFADVKAAWTDKSMWGLYLIGLVAYIPATPVQAYLTLTLRRVGGFSTLESNLLTALLTISDGGNEWGRFSLVTLISGYPYFHPLISSWISENTFDVKKRAITAATYNVIVQVYVTMP